MDVGFIGLGHMGSAMARNLLKAGHHVTLYNRTRAKAEPLVAAGARVVDTPSAACGGDVLITMLADDPAVETVVFGQEGVVAALPPNAIHVSMSTISVALSDRLAEAPARPMWRRLSLADRRRRRPHSCSSSPPAAMRPFVAASPCSTRSARGPSASATSHRRPTS
jgi:predicted dinucleotide-binding enzyme